MDWERLFAEFRDLGGVAENVRLGEGPFGRGIFVVDPAKPATLHASENLLVLVDDVEIRNGQMMVKAESSLGPREREFFQNFQRYFGWGAGLFDELWRSQTEWSRLPPEVILAITNIGALEDPDRRFLPPTVELCLYAFVRTRYFTNRAKPYLAPVVELGNHSSSAAGYVVKDGIGLTGKFDDEVFGRYNLGDSIGHALYSSFSDRAVFAHSLAVTVDIDGQKRISVARDINVHDLHDGIRYPRVTRDGSTIHLPFLVLGFTAAPDVPRAVFRKILSSDLTAPRADETFDTIAHFNRTKFLDLLRILDKYDTPLIRMLKEAAINQLETLSYCVGARSL